MDIPRKRIPLFYAALALTLLRPKLEGGMAHE